MRPQTWKPVLAAAATAIIVGALGAVTTDLSPWYYALAKPAWQPPDWLFGPAWTLIFAFAALAGVSAWRHARHRGLRQRILMLFAVNIILNILWSLLFFRLQRPDWALVEVAFLWLSIIVLIIGMWPISRAASWFLVPYLLWVSFASVLNLAIVRLNGPFGAG